MMSYPAFLVSFLFATCPRDNSPFTSRNSSDCSLSGSPVSTSAVKKPVGFHDPTQQCINTTISCSSNSPSGHSDANGSNTNTYLSPYSPMQVSTDGSHMERSSYSEESLGKSPVSKSPKKQNRTSCEVDQKSVSFPSTPNNNSIGDRDLNYNANNFERNISAHNIGISTLQQIFGTSNSVSSISLEHGSQSSEVLDNIKFKQDIGETVGKNDEKFSNKSPLRSSEDTLVGRSKVGEIINVEKNKGADVTSTSPKETIKQDEKKKEMVTAEVVSSDSSSAACGGSSQPSPICHKVGRKHSSYILKLSDKGRRSGKAHRMVHSVTEGSSTSSSFDEEHMVSHHKTGSSKRRDGTSRSMAEVSVLAVGNSPTHSSCEHRKNVDRVVADSFGDPDFGTPV